MGPSVEDSRGFASRHYRIILLPIRGLWALLLHLSFCSNRRASSWSCPRLSLRTRLTSLNALKSPSLSYALAVVPPDEAWDRLQRARHFAKDQSYTSWPPCIRLCHPFADDLAIDIADIIEANQIKPFEIKLARWSVIPHLEAMEADWDAMRSIAEEESSDSNDDFLTEEERQTQQLIEKEEVIGFKKMKERRRKAKHHSTNLPLKTSNGLQDGNNKTRLLQKQKAMYEEFNGPAVVCIEPDEESCALLGELRSLVLKELGKQGKAFRYYSATSSVSDLSLGLPKAAREAPDFRPIVPIAAFPTVSSAVEMARKLRTGWEPLSFPVADLHVISNSDAHDATPPDQSLNTEIREYSVQTQPNSNGSLGANGIPLERNEQFGCDALIALYGEEIQIDERETALMAQLLHEKGTEGGYCNTATLDVELESDSEDNRIEDWLEDDEIDEGTVFVMGRVHFFTGEMRQYVGMPAFSPVDFKDKVLGSSVSGAARRDKTMNGASERMKEGNWGDIV